MKKTLVIVVLIIIGAAVGAGFYLGKRDKSVTVDSGAGSNTSKTTTASNAKELDLSGKGITSVTSDIYGKTSTTSLILSNNSIKTLPSEMGKMTNLTTFKIDHNLLEGSLIGEIRQMSKLTNLDVSYNSMTGMPAEIGQLSHLETLNYSYNNIDGLPNELANLKNNLKVFDLTGNPLSQDKINKLRNDLPNTNIIF